MNVLYVVCMAVAAILAAIAALYRPNPAPPVNLTALAIAFIALAFVLQALVGGG